MRRAVVPAVAQNTIVMEMIHLDLLYHQQRKMAWTAVLAEQIDVQLSSCGWGGRG